MLESKKQGVVPAPVGPEACTGVMLGWATGSVRPGKPGTMAGTGGATPGTTPGAIPGAMPGMPGIPRAACNRDKTLHSQKNTYVNIYLTNLIYFKTNTQT